MLGDFVEIGDRVIINIEPDARAWGYNPVPDGTKAEIVGFSESYYGWANHSGLEPGVYANTHYVRLRLEDGREIRESTFRLEYATPEEKETYKARIEAARDSEGSVPSKNIRLSDLPFTEFIEGDVVRGQLDPHQFHDQKAVVAIVHYEYIGKLCNDGVTPMPLYALSDKFPSGWYQGITDHAVKTLELVERGRVWKYRHGEPIEFASVEDHADFLKTMGQTDELRNPANKLYSWTKEEAVEAIHSGTAHCITVGRSLFGEHITSVIRFKDEAVGEAIRQLSMKGFPHRVGDLANEPLKKVVG